MNAGVLDRGKVQEGRFSTPNAAHFFLAEIESGQHAVADWQTRWSDTFATHVDLHQYLVDKVLDYNATAWPAQVSLIVHECLIIS